MAKTNNPATPKANQAITIVSRDEQNHNKKAERGAALRQEKLSLAEYRQQMEANGQEINLPEWLQAQTGLNGKGE